MAMAVFIRPLRVRAGRGFGIPSSTAAMLSLHSAALFGMDGNTIRQHTLGEIILFGLPHSENLLPPIHPASVVRFDRSWRRRVAEEVLLYLVRLLEDLELDAVAAGLNPGQVTLHFYIYIYIYSNLAASCASLCMVKREQRHANKML